MLVNGTVVKINDGMYKGICGRFSYERSRFGGSRSLINVHPYHPYNDCNITEELAVYTSYLYEVKESEFICMRCGKNHSANELFYIDENGYKYCYECFEEKYGFCNDCGVVTEKKFLSDHFYRCAECYKNIPTCIFCGMKEGYDEYNFIEINRSDGDCSYICSHCKKSHPIIDCAECGQTILKEDAYEDDYGDLCLCQSCHEQRSHNLVKEYHYHHSKETKFFGENSKDYPYLGIELEVDRKEFPEIELENQCCSEIISIFPKHFIYMEHDGSLENGFENITSPATFKYHVDMAENYKKAFKVLTKNKYISHNSRTCGLHVHFNRDFYSDNEELYITRLLYLVEKFWDKMVIFSRRNVRSIERWANKYSDSPKDVVNNMKSGNLSRYYAINLTNENTIEFRMFRGTLKIDTFMATLELCNTMIVIAKEMSVEEIQSMKWEDLLKTDITRKYWNECIERQEKRAERKRLKEEEKLSKSLTE